MQHKIFQIESKEEGLSELIAGAIDIEDAIHHGLIENLDILSCGVNIPQSFGGTKQQLVFSCIKGPFRTI